MADSREATIIRTSYLGIAANVVLAAFKAVVGVLANSIAVTLDAVNNLSDALSSVITIVGTKLASKPADKKHPLGYGRVEYLSASIISVIVLYAGATSFVESAKKIISPEVPDYSPASLAIIASAVIVKLVLGRHVKTTGERVNSDALVASGSDALFDAILSTSVLAAAVVYMVFGVSLEAYVGVIISAVIVKSGVEMLQATLSQILGERVTPELARKVKHIAAQDPDVLGAFDLLLHSYGPERLVGSLHVEVPDALDAEAIDEMTRRVQHAVLEETEGEVVLATVGIYSHSTGSEAARVRAEVTRIVMSHDGVLQLHGFHLNEARKAMSFDVVMQFGPTRGTEFAALVTEVRTAFPGYTVTPTLDADLSD